MKFFSKWWQLPAVALGLTIAIALHSCNLTQPPGTSNTPGSQLSGSQIVTSILSDLKTFNSALGQESPNIDILTAAGLITENGKGEIEPELAESWKISDDKLKITFTLRPGLKWSDGQPLTVDDVVFTYNDIYLNEDIPTDTRDVLRIGQSRKLPTVRKLDARRVEFTTPERFAPFLRSTGAPILPAHILKKTITTKGKDGKPKFLTTWGVDTPPAKLVVAGQYKLESYTPNERYIFRRNPNYWRKDAQGNQQPYIERTVWEVVENTDTSLLRFRAGKLDAIPVPGDQFEVVNREKAQGKYTIYGREPGPGTNFISFNLNQGSRNGKPLVDPIKSRWFTNVKFRQAVAYAIDRPRMVNEVFRELGQPQNSPITVQSPYYLSPEEGLKVYDYNVEKAKQLLQEAGFKYNEQNELLDEDGNRVEFSLMTNAGNKQRESMVAQIQQDLGKIGMKVNPNLIDFGVLVDKLSNSLEWECYVLGLTGGVEPNNGANVWSPDGGLHSFNQKPQAGQPPIQGRVVYPWEAEIGKLYIQAAQEFDETKRKALYARTQQITQENLPVIYLVNPFAITAVRDRITGIKYSPINGAFWNRYELKAN
ncbi:MAG: ABC transporter substrate-binding protein [Cyanosarcina radialis HA8281-LM2]|jgi:peptide/nickel transport system substrate-binding protein|nr:ABC transporter substrate-binding protein [Cyanosarcina radialis HA8281-LM2]